jgi:hypothetical protein
MTALPFTKEPLLLFFVLCGEVFWQRSSGDAEWLHSRLT